MAETKFKIDYTEPENVQCKVPGEQQLREGLCTTAIDKATEWDENKVENPGDYTLAPVVTITKKEATFTKGDMKLQKVSVTEDISIRNGVFHTIKAPTYPLIHCDVIHHSPIRSMDHTSQAEPRDHGSRLIRRVSLETQNSQPEERRTRIPTRFKNAVNRVRRERSMPSKNIIEALPTQPRRSSIPILKPKELSPKPEDEFEKLFGEIADSPTDIDISLLNNKVDDPEKVEDCFEEIIHAYDDNKIQPITVEEPKQIIESRVPVIEKPKHSKIPMLKRKSEAEIDVPKSVQTNTKTSCPSSAKSRFKDAASKFSKAEVNESKQPLKKGVTTTANVDSDNVKLKTSYQKIKSISRDGQKHEIHVENIVRVSLEQDISPDNVVNIDNVGANEALESTIEIIEITPVEETVDLANEITAQPYTVEIVELPSDVIEIEETGKNEPKTEVFNADISMVETKTLIEPVKVISEDEYQDLVREISNRNETFEPVLDVNRNGTVGNNDYVIGNYAKERIIIEKEIVNPTHLNEDNKIDGIDENQTQLQKTIEFDSIENTNEEDVVVQTKSVLSKIAMFEQHRQEDIASTKIRPKPAVRCSFRRKLAEEEVLEPEKHYSNLIINKDLVTDDALDKNIPKLPTSRIPEREINHTLVDSTPIIVSEVIKPDDSNLYPYNEVFNTVKVETFNPEVNNNVVKSEGLKLTKMVIRTEEVSVSKAVEENIFENQTVVSEIKEDVIKYDKDNNERIKRHLPNRYYSFEVDYSKENPVNIEKGNQIEIHSLTPVEIEYAEPLNSNISLAPKSNDIKVQDAVVINKISEKPKFGYIRKDPKDSPFNFTPKTHDYKSRNQKLSPMISTEEILNTYKIKNEEYNLKKAKSVAELDIGDAVKGKVQDLIVRMKSVDKSVGKRDVISVKERPRKKSVSEKIALFEGVFSQATARYVYNHTLREEQKQAEQVKIRTEEDYRKQLDELAASKQIYGQTSIMPKVVLSNGEEMPVMAVGTALLDARLTPNIIATAIDLGYRAIDTAFIYGNEKEVGEGIKRKIDDGTVKREDLFVIAKLWSTFHRRDLVEKAYKQSLESLGLDYVDLYLIHNPMSFKEGPNPLPMIAKVVQYSEYDFLDAWFGMEDLVTKGLVKSIGLSNFNSSQVQKILDKARIKPVINQVECHPYLSQQRLYNFCDERNIKLSCFGVLGSKGTPPEHKNTTVAAIDDPLVQVMAAGLNVTPAQLLIKYQLQSDHAVVVKASSGAHLWDNLQALKLELTEGQMDALRALNRNKRTFVFKGMGDTHKNYPFHAVF